MNSLIFQTATRILLPVMLMLSVIVLLKGHNAPGGGFVGGLLAAAAFTLSALSSGSRQARRLLRVRPVSVIGVGLFTIALSGIPALFVKAPLLTGLWASISVPGFPEPLKIGTPLAFDIGVYLVVLGGTLLMALTLEEVRHEPAVRA